MVRCGGANVPFWEPGSSPRADGDSRLKDDAFLGRGEYLDSGSIDRNDKGLPIPCVVPKTFLEAIRDNTLADKCHYLPVRDVSIRPGVMMVENSHGGR